MNAFSNLSYINLRNIKNCFYDAGVSTFSFFIYIIFWVHIRVHFFLSLGGYETCREKIDSDLLLNYLWLKNVYFDSEKK